MTTVDAETTTPEPVDTTTADDGPTTQDLVETTTPEAGTTTPEPFETTTPEAGTTSMESAETTTSEAETTPTDVAIPTPLPPGGCRVFVSSSKHRGDLGGYEGADAKCQALADSNASKVEGDFKAWISTTDYSPSANFTDCTNGYYLVTGEKIADNLTDLISAGNLDVSINVNEKAFVYSNTQYVWTGTKDNGTPAGSSDDGRCKDWTRKSERLQRGFWGKTNQVDKDWTKRSKTGCANEKRIYCFEQPSMEPEQTTTQEPEPVVTTTTQEPEPEQTTTQEPELVTTTANPGMCAYPQTVTTDPDLPMACGGLDEAELIVNLEGNLGAISDFSIEVEISATWASDLEITVVAPDGVMYTIVDFENTFGGEFNTADLGDESGNPTTYTFAPTGVPFGSVLLGNGTDGDPIRLDPDQVYQAFEWPGPQNAGVWSISFYDNWELDETCIGALHFNYCAGVDIAAQSVSGSTSNTFVLNKDTSTIEGLLASKREPLPPKPKNGSRN